MRSRRGVAEWQHKQPVRPGIFERLGVVESPTHPASPAGDASAGVSGPGGFRRRRAEQSGRRQHPFEEREGDLRCPAYLVLASPNGVAVFEVTLEFFYENTGGGMIQVSFASGSFGVMCPAVVIAILS